MPRHVIEYVTQDGHSPFGEWLLELRDSCRNFNIFEIL